MYIRILLLVALSIFLKEETMAQTWTLIKSTNFTVMGYRNIAWDSIYAGVDYKLEMRGTWSDCSSGCGYDTRFVIAGGINNFNNNYFIEGPHYLRNTDPTPNTYDATNHKYSIFFTGADTLIWLEYHDNGYFDNSGTVYFDLYTDCTFPTFEASDDVTICANTTIDLTATGGLKYRWYDVPTGGTPIATTATFTTPLLTTTTIYYVSSYYQLGCESDRQAVTVTVESCPNEWTGTASSDWNDGSNWSFATVPTVSEDVEIASGAPFQPHVTLATPTPAVCNALSILSGATLTVDAGKALTVSGATSNAGTILVKADATGIGSFIDNGSIGGGGIFQMEQYLTGAGGGTPNREFYYVSSPVVGATAAAYDLNNGSKLWDADEVNQNYPQITNDATVLNPTQGYVARMGAAGTLSLTGSSFNTGNQSATGLTRTGNTEANRGYNLVGNPYPSSVNWDATVKTNVGTTIWYRTHTAGNVMTYDTYNESGPGVGTSNNFTGNDVTGIIAPGQAFWVRVIADETSNGSVFFTNAMRSHGILTSIYKQEAEEGIVRFNLSNGTVSDETIIHFNTEALDDFDAYDSQKMWAGNIPQLYTTTGADSLTINGLYSTATNPIVDLGVKLPSSGNYTLNATSITITNESVYLEDRMLNIFQDLNVEPNYSFTSVAGNIGDRFALHFNMSITGIGRDAMHGVSTQVYTSNGNTLNIILSENTENGKVDVMDMAGRIVGSFNLSTNRTSVNMNVSTGVYLVRVETENGMDTHRILLN